MMDTNVETEQTVSATNHVRTFVIFDTETTGLPSVGNNPKITELCFIALTRDELITKHSFPRVLNKLLICFNPGKKIGHEASQTSGLHNGALKVFVEFKKQAPIVCTFLRNLPLPACLIAHNGNRFDFPLLVSELKNANEEIPDGILCADSLEAFRMFDGLPPVPEFVLQKKQALARVGGAALADAVHESASPIPRNLKTANMGTNSLKRTSECADLTVVATSKQHKACLKLGNDWKKVENAPTKPAKKEAVFNGPSPPPLQKRSVQKKRTEVEIQRNITETRRQLFVDRSDDQPHGGTKCTGSEKPDGEKKYEVVKAHKQVVVSYSLNSVYARMFGQQPEIAHTAEDDCLTLLRLIHKKMDVFPKWCDKHAVSLKNKEPMY